MEQGSRANVKDLTTAIQASQISTYEGADQLKLNHILRIGIVSQSELISLV